MKFKLRLVMTNERVYAKNSNGIVVTYFDYIKEFAYLSCQTIDCNYRKLKSLTTGEVLNAPWEQ